MTTIFGIPIIEGKKDTRKGFLDMLDGQGVWTDPITGDVWDGVWLNG